MGDQGNAKPILLSLTLKLLAAVAFTGCSALFVFGNKTQGGTLAFSEAVSPILMKDPRGRGVSVAMATRNRYDYLILYIPKYLQHPIVRDIVVVDDFGSDDAARLATWLQTTPDIPRDMVHRVRLYNSTGKQLGGLRNKIRALGLANEDWVALLDSDNYASPEHYWDVLTSHWTAQYGSAPPPVGNADAERRIIHPTYWRQVPAAAGPVQIRTPITGVSYEHFYKKCSHNGSVTETLDPNPAIGGDCWQSFPRDQNMLNIGNCVMHRPSVIKPFEFIASKAAENPKYEPAGMDAQWMAYWAVAKNMLLEPVKGFWHDHVMHHSGDSFFQTTGDQLWKFWGAHKLWERPTTAGHFD